MAAKGTNTDAPNCWSERKQEIARRRFVGRLCWVCVCVFVFVCVPCTPFSHPHRDHRIGIYSSMCSPPHKYTHTLATLFIQSRQRPDTVNVAVDVAVSVDVYIAVDASCAAAGNPYSTPKAASAAAVTKFTKTT